MLVYHCPAAERKRERGPGAQVSQPAELQRQLHVPIATFTPRGYRRSVTHCGMGRVTLTRGEATVDELWERVATGGHTAVVGAVPAEPPAEFKLFVVRVSCDGPDRPLGPVLDARDRVERSLGSAADRPSTGGTRTMAAIRRRMLGDEPEPASSAALVSSLNRLGRETDRPCALVFESVEAADPATLELLREMAERPGWLRIPLVLSFDSPNPTGAAADILLALERAEGSEAVLHTKTADEARTTGTDLPALRDLPRDVLRVLRAGALVGACFEPHLVATLLRLDESTVLEQLQVAADLGVPIEDRADGSIRLPRPVAHTLRAGLLPALATVWHRRLAEILTGPGPAAESPPNGAERPLPGDAPSHRPFPTPLDRAAIVPGPPLRFDDGEDEVPPLPVGPEPLLRDEPPPVAETLDSAREQAPIREIVWGADARAARHLVAAGDFDGAARRFLAAAREAAGVGAPSEALAFTRNALSLIVQLPASPPRRRLRAQILTEMARFQWEASGPGADFTFAGALYSLEAAAELLRPDDPPQVLARIAAITAAVCYDIGDSHSLERALTELTKACRALEAMGDPVGAARLLNDQAAVWVRLGDPERARHLLEQSRSVFESRAQEDPIALVELAETDHLLARLPLHADARAAEEAAAWEQGLEHARAAEAAYHRLGAVREVARVWETMGRLELRAGRADLAAELLTRAVDAQQSAGDVLGLARSAGALSEVLTEHGRHYEALAVLGESIELNLEKGSRRGLAYNREALTTLSAELPRAQHTELIYEVQRLEQRLAAAEAALGR